MKRVLILGGGFGGLYAALELDKHIGKRDDVESPRNRENFFSFTPMLHEVAASDLDVTTSFNPCEDAQNSRALLPRRPSSRGSRPPRRHRVPTLRAHAHELAYDHLNLSLGSNQQLLGLPGLEERALTMKSLRGCERASQPV